MDILPGHTIGIDLGTTYSSVGVFLNGKVEIIPSVNGKTRIPSYVAFIDSGRLFGDKAKEQLLTNPTNTIYDGLRLIDRQFKELIFLADMKRWDFKVINHEDKPKVEIQWKGESKTFAPEEIIAMTLGHLKETAEKYLGGTVTNAIVSLPSSFTFSQRRAITDAGQIACLNIQRTAAALAFGVQQMPPAGKGDRTVLVFDNGGGSTNVSIVTIEDGIFDVKSIAGDAHLGGEDFDTRMVNHFVVEFKRRFDKDLLSNPKALLRLRTACEKAKHSLSESYEASIKIDSLMDGINFDAKLTRDQFEGLCMDLFYNTIACVKKAVGRIHPHSQD